MDIYKKKEADKNLPHKTESEKRPAVAVNPFAV
jgi:hypothetical protein